MRVVTFINLKGGVGKTSSAFHLSGALAERGLRVLLVDNDPQASLTQGFLGPDGAAALDPGRTVAALYDPDFDPDPGDVLVPTGVPGVTLAPGSAAAARWNRAGDADWPASQGGVAAFLGEVAGGFDVALVDCPPNLYLCSWAALLGTDAVVVPLQPEDFGSQGLAPVLRAVDGARGENPRLALAGLLLTMVAPRTAVHALYEGSIRAKYGDAVFAARVPRAADYAEAVAARTPVTAYKRRSAAAAAVRAVAAELLVRAAAGGERGAA